MITNIIVDHLYKRNSRLYHDPEPPWLSPENLSLYAAAVHNRDAALNNCWGFVDETVTQFSDKNETKEKFTMVINEYMPLSINPLYPQMA